MKQHSQEHVNYCRKFFDVTDNGVAFEWGLAGPDGAWFVLIREPQHTDQDIETAKTFLRRGRDVVSLRVVNMVIDEG